MSCVMDGIGTYTIDENVIGHIARYATVHDMVDQNYRFQWSVLKSHYPVTSPDEQTVEFRIATTRGDIKFLIIMIGSNRHTFPHSFTGIYDRFDSQKICGDAMRRLESLTCFDYALPTLTRNQILSTVGREITRMMTPEKYAEMCVAGSYEASIPIPIDRNLSVVSAETLSDAIMLYKSWEYAHGVDITILIKDVFGVIDCGCIEFENRLNEQGCIISTRVVFLTQCAQNHNVDYAVEYDDIVRDRSLWETDIVKCLNDAGFSKHSVHICAQIVKIVDHPRFMDIFDYAMTVAGDVMKDILGSAYIPIITKGYNGCVDF